MSVTIIPTIWVKTAEELQERFNRIKDQVERVHYDVIDGVFVDYLSPGPEELKNVVGKVKLDAHLMVDDPIRWLERCKEGGVERVFGQVERMPDKNEFIAQAQLNFGVGLAFDIDTPLHGLEEVIEDLDAVLLMGYKAGVEGQTFDERVLPKIEQVRKMHEETIICVDGGLGVEEIIKCLAAEWAEEIREDQLHQDFLNMEFMVGKKLTLAENVQTAVDNLRHLRR